jgi:proliferating cell nuclear antigen
MELQINEIYNCDLFAALFQNLKLFAENINISFDETHMFFQSMDSAQISVMELNIPKEWFDSYRVPKQVTVGVNAALLSKILSTREKNQSIHISFIEDTDVLHLLFTSQIPDLTEDEENHKKSASAAPKSFDKRFELPLVSLDSDHLTIPIQDYDAEFSLNSGHFAALVNQLKIFGDTMDVECCEEHIVLYSRSHECGKMSVNINIDDLTMFSITENDRLNVSFSILFA